MSLHWWEFLIRGTAVYFALFIMLKVTGRKQISQLSPFDFVLLLILSNSVQNSMNGGDNSLIGGLIIATGLVTVNWLMNYFIFKNKSISILFEGKPEVLIHNGRLFEQTLKKENISHTELMSILRKNGVLKMEDVHYAIIEPTGGISVIPKQQ